MNGIIAWFARNHVAANLLMGLMIVGGVFSLPNIQQRSFPDINIDVVKQCDWELQIFPPALTVNFDVKTLWCLTDFNRCNIAYLCLIQKAHHIVTSKSFRSAEFSPMLTMEIFFQFGGQMTLDWNRI